MLHTSQNKKQHFHVVARADAGFCVMEMAPLVSPSSAYQSISASLSSLASEVVALENAYGRVLRKPVFADRHIPPFDRAMMDGIAVDSKSGRTAWQIAGTQAAGKPTMTLPDDAACIEVMTGAPVPLGCDCVIPIEQLELTHPVAQLADTSYEVRSGDFIHATASDHAAGTTLLDSGTILTAPELATAASCGATQLTVAKLPQICLITSGDEVVSPATQPDIFQIRSSHPTAIRACIENQRLGNVTHLHIADDPDATHQSIHAAIHSHDLLILTGGVSKGKFDYIAPVLEKMAGPPLFHGVSQRPGKPFGYFHAELPIFALPGNPLSVMACLARYVIPALHQMLGAPYQPAVMELAAEANAFPHLTHLLAATAVDGKLKPAKPNNSGDYAALHSCQGVCEIQASDTNPAAGTSVNFYPWT